MTCATLTLLSACSEKDLYEGPDSPDNPKSIDEYFDFSTRADFTLNLDYGYPGYRAPFSLYAENPVESDGISLKEGVEPIYSAFTFEDNTFNAKVQLPSAIQKVYLHTYGFGLPTCVELDVKGNTIAYENNIPTLPTTRADEDNCAKIGNNLKTINSGYKLYALYDRYDDKTYYPSNSKVTGVYGKVGSRDNISSTETRSTIGQLNGRAVAALRPNGKKDNLGLVRDAETTNISIKKYKEDGKTEIKSAHIDLVALSSNPGGWHNTLGYYYYKTGTTLTAAELRALPKYMVFPRLVTGKPDPGFKVRLQFFGENYNEAGTGDFPSGYTIGWCMIANIGTTSDLGAINRKIATAYEDKKVVYSNYFEENQVRSGFITLVDKTSGKLVLGIEDTAFQRLGISPSDNSYEDMLFYVDADPMEAITGTDKPIIEDKEIISTETTTGTLAFEDIWPTGGDYDMNDVVVKYSTVVTYNQKNEVKSVVDFFTPVHDGADYKNAFGYVINNEVGEINAEESSYFVKEDNNQFIMFANAKEVQNETFSLTRIFAEGNYPDKAEFARNYNPFIVVNYQKDAKNRTEVHLPKFPATSWADQSEANTADDAYFIDKGGKFPFAIDLPISTFKVAVERIVSISDAYPKFANWVNSNGSIECDWYLYPETSKVQD